MKLFFRSLIILITLASIFQSFAKTINGDAIKAKEGGGSEAGRDPGV